MALFVIHRAFPSTLYRIDPADPDSTTSPFGEVGDLFNNAGNVGGATEHDGFLYVIDNNRWLSRINPEDPDDETGDFGRIATRPSEEADNPGALVSHDGSLYAVTGLAGPDGLWRINPDDPSDESGDFGLVGPLPTAITVPAGLASHDGNLYAVDQTTDELWRINPDDPTTNPATSDPWVPSHRD